MGWNKPEPQPEPQPLNIQPERTSTNKTAIPIPVFWGLHRSAGTYLDGIWDSYTVPITERVKTGKRSSTKITKAIHYYGSIAQCIGFAKLTKLHTVIKDDEPAVSPEYTFAASEHMKQFDVRDNVNMVLWNGTQERVTGFNPLTIHPGYKHMVCIHFDKLLFGESPTPPNYELVFESVFDPFKGHISKHQSSDGGQFIPEIIYSALTNPIFGGQVPADRFDLPSWYAACERLITEDLGYSAVLRSKKSIDSWVKELLNFCGGNISDVEGKLVFSLQRDDAEVRNVSSDHFLKDAVITPNSWENTEIINEARVSYHPIEANLESTEVVETDDASQQIAGLRTKAYSFDGIRSQRVAALTAHRIAKAKGFPTVSYEFEFDSSLDNLKKGDLIRPNFPAQGLTGKNLRVTDITVGDPSKSSVKVKAKVDKSFIFSTNVSTQDEEVTFSQADPKEITGHVIHLPTAQLEGFNDGFILAMSRKDRADDRAFISFSHDDNAYETIIAARTFPLKVFIEKWRDFGNGNFTADFTFSESHEEQTFLDSIANGAPDWHMLCQPHKAGQPLQEASWSSMRRSIDIQPLGGGKYSVSFASAQFDTMSFANGSSSAAPSRTAYISNLGAFTTYRSNQLAFSRDLGNAVGDTGKVRHLSIQSARRTKLQPDDEVSKLSYNRPTGAFTPTWGGQAPHDFEFGINSSSTTGNAPLTSLLEITGTENADYTIDWGDGSTPLTATNQSMPQSYTHDYTTAGSYTAEVTISPTAGGSPMVYDIAIQVTAPPGEPTS